MLHLDPPKDFSPKIEVVSCFLEHDGEILMTHYQPHKFQGNKWGVPAGKIKAGEIKEAALAREVHEETGIKLAPENFKFIKTTYVRYPEFDFIYYIYHHHLKKRPTVIIDPKEHQAYQWLSPTKALALPLIDDEEPCIRLMYDL